MVRADDKTEHKLEIYRGSPAILVADTEGASGTTIHLRKMSVGEEVMKVPVAAFTITNPGGLLFPINEYDEVRYYRRETGEAIWGDTFFYGEVRTTGFGESDGSVELGCRGMLDRLADREIHDEVFGMTHTVDRELPVVVSQAGGVLARTYADITGVTSIQKPIESCKVLRSSNIVNGGYIYLTDNIQNDSVGGLKMLAMPFNTNDGPIRKCWFMVARSAGITQPLDVAIQQDVNGSPSGVDIEVARVPAASIPVGSGNVTWTGWDFLFGGRLGLPGNLFPPRDWQYWLVLRVPSVTAGNVGYYARTCTSPQPDSRRYQFNTGGAWGAGTGGDALFYCVDQEGDWIESAPEHMVIDTMVTVPPGGAITPRIYFQKYDTQNGDGGQISYIALPQPTILYSGMVSCRVSYWSQPVPFINLILKLLQEWAQDLYDGITLNVTDPGIVPFALEVENDSVLAVMNKLREKAPIHISIHYDSVAGTRELRVDDQLVPDGATWALYNPAEQARRTYCHGEDIRAGSSGLLIHDLSCRREGVERNTTRILVNSSGQVTGVHSETTIGTFEGGHAPVRLGLMDGWGGSFQGGSNQAEYQYTDTRTIRQGGTLTLMDIDESIATGPFRPPYVNQLAHLESSRHFLDAIVVITKVTWSGGENKGTKCILDWFGATFSQLPPSPGGPPAESPVTFNPGLENLPGGLGGTLAKLTELSTPSNATHQQTREGIGTGVSEAPCSNRRTRGTQSRSHAIVYQPSGTGPYVAGAAYHIRVGTGNPGLGLSQCTTPIAEAPCEVSIDLTGAYATLKAEFNQACFPANQVWPTLLTEMDLARCIDLGDPLRTYLEAWGFSAPPSGAANNFWNRQIELHRDGHLEVMIRLPMP